MEINYRDAFQRKAKTVPKRVQFPDWLEKRLY
jgi:hypothetical protein